MTHTDPNEIIGQKLLAALHSYQLIYQQGINPEDSFHLVDVLIPDYENTVETGIKELENLADYIIGVFINAGVLPNPLETNKGDN